MQRHLKDYFIPHAGNDYQPHSLQRFAVGVMMILILLTFAIANLQSVFWIASDWMVSTILPAVVVEETNDERAESTLSALARNSTLDTAAQLKAEHMATNSYFAHYSPDGVSPWYWFGEAGYSFVHAGENLAVHFTDSGKLVDAWMDSPTHRANILNGQYQEIGIGTAKGTYEGFDTVFVVQLFGTPAAPNPEPLTPVATVAGTVATTSQAADAPTPPPISQTAVDPATSTQTAGAEATVTESSTRTANSPTIPTNTRALPAEISTESSELATAPPSTTSSPSIFTGFISTSTTAVPARIAPIDGTADSEVGVWARLGTQPQTVLQLVYALLALLVVGALGLSVVIEIRHQAPLQAAYAIMLLFVMGGLWYVHSTLTAGTLIV